jgi:IS5 family transposase
MKRGSELDLPQLRHLIEKGIAKAGSKRQLAITLGLSGQTSNINFWLKGERPIPEHRLRILLRFLRYESE